MNTPDVPKGVLDRTKSIVRVGHGRGFVVDNERLLPGLKTDDPPLRIRERLVITAAHCLQRFRDETNDEGVLEQVRYDGIQDRIAEDGLMQDYAAIFRNLLGSLEDSELCIWGDCWFVDPVADIAILGAPDSQALSEQYDAYEEWIERADPIGIGRLRVEDKRAFVLSLKGEWVQVASPVRANANLMTRSFWVEDSSPFEAGMSGSPLVTDDGRAIALISTISIGGGPNAAPLLNRLPGWLFDPAVVA